MGTAAHCVTVCLNAPVIPIETEWSRIKWDDLCALYGAVASWDPQFDINKSAWTEVVRMWTRVKEKPTYTHGSLKSCWTTPGCRRCSWGEKAFQWCFGWCCTVGQRTWTRCAPAPWNAWIVPLEKDENQDQTLASRLIQSNLNSSLFMNRKLRCPVMETEVNPYFAQ